MGVYIKGMDEIPEDGAVLVVRRDDNGKAYIKYACTYGYSMEMVKVSEPHGDLIDKDDICFSMTNGTDQDIAEEALKEAPTIIEAEGE